MEVYTNINSAEEEKINPMREGVISLPNQAVIDNLGESSDGKLTYKGEMISGGGSASLDIEVKTDTEDEYVLEITTDTETVTTANLKGKEGKQGKSGVYVGSGDMPEGYNVQINPEGEAVELITAEQVNALIDEKLGVIENGYY